MTKIFIYGTLKRGYSNHHYMEGQQFVGLAQTAPHYRLVSMGSYPGMVTSEPGRTIEGEVWEVDDECRRRLDVLEGIEEGEYAYELVPLLAPFANEPIHGYRYLRPVDGCPDIGTRWIEP